MIHYHGTPMSGSRQDTVRFLQGRHALVPFPRRDDLGAVSEVCKTFIFDNGAFSVWKRGGKLDVQGYVQWVRDWCLHPGFQWALIPDIIDGGEPENDAEIERWLDTGLGNHGVPVWHLHESVGRLVRLCHAFPLVALGSSGAFASPGAPDWWGRMHEAIAEVCDAEGRPISKLHGLRMLDPRIFTHLPLASADSTNAARNCSASNWSGPYMPPTNSQRACVIADRVESHNSAHVFHVRLKKVLPHHRATPAMLLRLGAPKDAVQFAADNAWLCPTVADVQAGIPTFAEWLRSQP